MALLFDTKTESIYYYNGGDMENVDFLRGLPYSVYEETLYHVEEGCLRCDDEVVAELNFEVYALVALDDGCLIVDKQKKIHKYNGEITSYDIVYKEFKFLGYGKYYFINNRITYDRNFNPIENIEPDERLFIDITGLNPVFSIKKLDEIIDEKYGFDQIVDDGHCTYLIDETLEINDVFTCSGKLPLIICENGCWIIKNYKLEMLPWNEEGYYLIY